MKRLISLLAFLCAVPVLAPAQNPIFFQSAFTSQTAATPTFTPTSPYSGGSTTVTISDATGGATIFYCTDTTNTCTPTTTYTTGLSFTSTEYIRAYATASGYNPSAVASWSGTYVAPILVQAAYSATDGVWSATLTNHTAGDCLVVAANFKGSNGPTAISNTAGYNWATSNTGFQFNATINIYGYEVWVVPVATTYTGSDTISITDADFHGGVAFLEFTGTGRTCAIDAYALGGASTYSTMSSGSFSLTGTSDILIGIGQTSSSSTPGSGFTQLSGGSQWPYGLLEYLGPTSGSVSATGGPAANPWTILGVGIK